MIPTYQQKEGNFVTEERVLGGGEALPGIAATQNACKLCTPLGACLVFKGIRGAMPFLHGSQGCATYIRRYLISHFREPMDIAASNFSEEAAVFGGTQNLMRGLRNVLEAYRPELIGLATTCLSETIGEDVGLLVEEARATLPNLPPVVHVSTASYRGSHADGFHAATAALVAQLAEPTSPHGGIAIFPGILSAADLRHLREIACAFGREVTIVPDYSDTLDGPTWATYEPIPPGGTPVEALRALPGCAAAIELGATLIRRTDTAAAHLAAVHAVPRFALPLPIGIRATDRFLATLAEITGRRIPAAFEAERGRLADALIDGHKIVYGKRVAVYGEADLVIGLSGFLAEMGGRPVLCAAGGEVRDFAGILREAVPALPEEAVILNGKDFAEIGKAARQLNLDLLVGNSKGYPLARELGLPLLRVGFPIHDRIGAQRILHVGYRGALALFDSLANSLLERKQSCSAIGYSYL
ncbi:MAG: hypothetical protein N2035_09015 [Chthoniobacterales bacterium]|nr:hypothetical protein [Chthoniobacterales bacterium]